jgi:hypothetical protein
VAFLVDREEHLIPMPLVTWSRTPASQLIGILLPEFPTPLAEGFGRDNDPTNAQEFFHISMAERKAAIQPDGVADDLPWEPVMFVEIWRG